MVIDKDFFENNKEKIDNIMSENIFFFSILSIGKDQIAELQQILMLYYQLDDEGRKKALLKMAPILIEHTDKGRTQDVRNVANMCRYLDGVIKDGL